MNADSIFTLKRLLEVKLQEAVEAEVEAEEAYGKAVNRYESLSDAEYYSNEAEEEALFEEAERRYRLTKDLKEEARLAVDLAEKLYNSLESLAYLESRA